MGKRKSNAVTAVSGGSKDFKKRLATAKVTTGTSSKVNKLKSTKPIAKNLKKILHETRTKVSDANFDFDHLQNKIYENTKAAKEDAQKKRKSFEKLIPADSNSDMVEIDATLAQFSNFYPLAGKN